MSSGDIEICYGTVESDGRGNVRDSNPHTSAFTYNDYTTEETATNSLEEYVSKNENGIDRYGENYPLYNYLNNFYTKVQI